MIKLRKSKQSKDICAECTASYDLEVRVYDKYDKKIFGFRRNDSARGIGCRLGPGFAQKACKYNAAQKVINELEPMLIDKIDQDMNLRRYEAYVLESNNVGSKSTQSSTSENLVIWTGYNCKDVHAYAEKPFQEISRKVETRINDYLTPRTPINIKPQIPPMIMKPDLPEPPKLTKSQFETKDMFQKRVEEALSKRNEVIERLQKEYRSNVEERNRIINKLKESYERDVLKIKGEQQSKNKNLPRKIMEVTRQSFFDVMGNPVLKDATYDAETQTMYASISSINANYENKIKMKVPLSKAKELYENTSRATPIVVFEIKKSTIRIDHSKVAFQGNEYLCDMTDEDFSPEKIEVRLKDEKVEFATLDQVQLELQNPNLTDQYHVKAFTYSERPKDKGIVYDDELKRLIRKAKKNEPRDTNWLFIIAVENYDESDPVIYSKNSAATFKMAAQKKFGIDDRHTYALIEDKATSGSIKDKLTYLLRSVKAGDTIYFYYSGHGVPNPQTGESFILPKDKVVDFISKEDEFSLRRIYKRLSESNASRIIVFIDACFSGKTDNLLIFKGVGPGLIKTREVSFNKRKMAVMTAGKNNQFSNSYDEKGHRMFTYFLIKSLYSREKVDLDTVYKEVSVNVKDASWRKGDVYLQEPQIEGNLDLL